VIALLSAALDVVHVVGLLACLAVSLLVIFGDILWRRP